MGADPCPLDSIAATFTDHANIPAYSRRPIIGVSAEFFELQRIVSGIFQKKSKGATRRLFLRGIQLLVRLPKAPSNSGNHIRFRSRGSLPSAVACSMKACSFGRGVGSLMISSQRSSSTCASSRSLSRTACRSASLSLGSSLMISDALTAPTIILSRGFVSAEGERGRRRLRVIRLRQGYDVTSRRIGYREAIIGNHLLGG